MLFRHSGSGWAAIPPESHPHSKNCSAGWPASLALGFGTSRGWSTYCSRMSDQPHPWGPRLPGVSPADYEARRDLDGRMDRDRLSGMEGGISPPPRYLQISLQEAIDIYLAAAKTKGLRPTETVKGSSRRFGGPTAKVFKVTGHNAEGSPPTLQFGEDGLIYQNHIYWQMTAAEYEQKLRHGVPDLKHALLFDAGLDPRFG